MSANQPHSLMNEPATNNRPSQRGAHKFGQGFEIVGILPTRKPAGKGPGGLFQVVMPADAVTRLFSARDALFSA